LKQEVARTVSTFLEEFQQRVAQISDEDVEHILEQGEIYANKVANAKLAEVQRAVGLLR
jgi:hypothetical protein